VWLKKAEPNNTEFFYFYGIGGRRMGVYRKFINGGNARLSLERDEVYFAGKRIRSGGYAVAEDRLGSTRKGDGVASKFYPYGEEFGATPTAEDRTKFATYYRDSGTGLDYADRRYYDKASGRFLTADPYMASGGPEDPGSWNRYAYVAADPVNFNDPIGLAREEPVNDWGLPPSWRIITQVISDGEVVTEVPIIGFWQGPRPSRRSPRLSNTERAEQHLMPALSRAIQALTLNEECLELFGNEETRSGKYNPVTVLTDLVMGNISGGQSSYGNLTWRAGTGADVTANGIPFLAGSATIKIGVASWNGGDVNENAHTLLHELGHFYDVVRGAGGSAIKSPDALPGILGGDSRSKENDWLVDQKCFGGALGYEKPE
jgi:RHS repeat-associated protein